MNSLRGCDNSRLLCQQRFEALLRILGVLCALCVVLSLTAHAQDADVSGAVRDKSGAAIAGASVKLTNEATGTTLASQTNDKGLYSFPHVQAAVYDIAVSAPGFQSQTRTGITVNVTERAQANFDLKVGAIKEIVTVTAE